MVPVMGTHKENMMKTLRFALITLAALVLAASPVQAQRLIVNTTTSAALTATDTTVSLTATTSVAAGQFAFVDQELMRVNSVDTTASTISVQRGQGGTAAVGHATGETIFISDGGDYRNVDPSYSGACQRGVNQAAILPWINTSNGNIWKCLPGAAGGTAVGVWNGTNTTPLTYNSVQTGAI